MNNKGWGLSTLIGFLAIFGVFLLISSILYNKNFSDINDIDEEETEEKTKTEVEEAVQEEEESSKENITYDDYQKLETVLKDSAEKYIKNKKISTNRNLSQKNIYLKYIDRNFSLILLIMLAIMIILMFFNNLHLKKIIKVLDSKMETKEVVKKDKIIFLGDSITCYYDLKKYYDNKNIINQGIEGNTTKDVLERLQTGVYDYNVKKVILLIGTNDIGNQEDPIENIKLIINKIKSHDNSIEIIVESIYPINNTDDPKVSDYSAEKRSNEKIKETNKKIKEICKEKNITYVNVYDELTDKNGNLKLEYTVEGLHISDEGYKKITNVLSKYVN